jgi:hypothetical protein
VALTGCGGPAGSPTAAGSPSPSALATPDVDVALTAGDAPENPLLAFDSVWVVAHHARAVVRLSRSGAVLARIDTAAEEPGGMVAGAGLVWVTHYGPGRLLVAIDPKTNKVVHRYPLAGDSCCEPAVLGRTVWVTSSADGAPAVLGIDTTTGRTVKRLDGAEGPMVVGSQLWVVHDGQWEVADVTTGTFTPTAIPPGIDVRLPQPAAGLIWGMRAGAAVGLTPTGTVQQTIRGAKGARLYYGEDGVAKPSGDVAWVTDSMAKLWRIDPGAKDVRLVATFPSDRALSMIGDGTGGVWVAVFNQSRVVHYAG